MEKPYMDEDERFFEIDKQGRPPLTDEDGEVRELTEDDRPLFRPNVKRLEGDERI